MKKLFLIIWSVAMIGICSLVQAQDQDTASTNYNNRSGFEETTDDIDQRSEQTGEDEDDIEQGAEEASDDIQEGTQEAGDEIQQGAQSTEQQLEEDTDAMEENFEGSTIDKVGPNGEKLFMEDGRYYYYNDDGKKVKVKKSEVKDKSDMDDQ